VGGGTLRGIGFGDKFGFEETIHRFGRRIGRRVVGDGFTILTFTCQQQATALAK
jgi:hypothetical protein